MKTIAFAALAVLGLVLGTLSFAAPVHAANYYYGIESGLMAQPTAAATDTTRIVKREEAGTAAGLFRFR